MSVVALWATSARAPTSTVIEAMLGASSGAGPRPWDCRAAGGCALGVSRLDWERGPSLAGGLGLLVEGTTAVAADASLYYREDLVRTLDERSDPSAPAPRLILAAYRRWGPRLAEHLEGDFAFVVWDARRSSVVAARDLTGHRRLHFAEPPGGVALASDAGSLLKVPGVPSDPDLGHVGAVAAALATSGDYRTAYAAVRAVPAGHTLEWSPAAGLRVTPHWRPPTWQRSRVPFDDAALELRDLLRVSVRERLDRDGPTAVTLSGGWDSTSVFASGADAVGRGEAGGSVIPVSMSYPVDDPGNEDDYIRAVAERWTSPVRWVHSADVSLLHDLADRVAERADPFFHFFEEWNRALARRAAAAGCRVTLTGNGGDSLFQLTDVFLADLFRRGRWPTLVREWRSRDRAGFRNAVRWILIPNLPRWSLDVVGRLRGAPLLTHVERTLPSWIRPEFARRERLAERERAVALPAGYGSRAEAEAAWYLVCPYFPTVFGELARVAGAEGTEIRSPLLDRRLIDFAATRPRAERSSGAETKRLLRAAMRGLLPDAVLAPRTRRTGVLGGYVRAELERGLARARDDVAASDFLLADLGIVEPRTFYGAVERVLRDGDTPEGARLIHTIQTEMWLRREAGHERVERIALVARP